MLDFLQDLVTRSWNDLIARPSGPFGFRFLLQPIMAAITAIRAGAVDARTGRSPYLWMIVRDKSQRMASVREGLSATSRIFFLGIAIDAIYQFVALRKFYPGEALIVAFVLAVVPYFLIRGPSARIFRWRSEHRSAHKSSHKSSLPH